MAGGESYPFHRSPEWITFSEARYNILLFESLSTSICLSNSITIESVFARRLLSPFRTLKITLCAVLRDSLKLLIDKGVLAWTKNPSSSGRGETSPIRRQRAYSCQVVLSQNPSAVDILRVTNVVTLNYSNFMKYFYSFVLRYMWQSTNLVWFHFHYSLNMWYSNVAKIDYRKSSLIISLIVCADNN